MITKQKKKKMPLLWAYFFFLAIITSTWSLDYCDKENCKCRENIKELRPDVPSIVYKKIRGRLGNQINGYALQLQLQRTHGYESFMLQESLDILQTMFTSDSIELPVLEKTFCDVKKMKFEVFEGNFTHLIVADSKYKHGHLLNLYPPQEKQVFIPPATREYKKGRLDTYKYLRHKLKIRPEFVAKAQETFRQVADRMGTPVDKLNFVCIHHRRTDFTQFARSTFNEKPLKKSYFYDAMEHFREEFDSEPVAFLYISDDMAWGRKNIKDKHKDLFFVSSGDSQDSDSIGHDFALLVHSNATITTLGSFSLWGSILNGQDTYNRYGPISRQFANALII